MTVTVKEIEDVLFQWAPRSLSEEWDNVGLQCGDPMAQVRTILVSLDATPNTLSKALEQDADLIVTHHPLIFKPLHCVNLKEYTSRLLAGFLRHEISVISMHTNLDSCSGGVNDRLCELLEIEETRPIIPSRHDASQGLGRIGRLGKPMGKEEFLDHVTKRLGLRHLTWAGNTSGPISDVAVCSGSGSSLFPEVTNAKVQAFVTAEVKHSVALQAKTYEMIVVDADHFHTERPVVENIFGFLSKEAKKRQWDTRILTFEEEKCPLRYWP